MYILIFKNGTQIPQIVFRPIYLPPLRTKNVPRVKPKCFSLRTIPAPPPHNIKWSLHYSLQACLTIFVDYINTRQVLWSLVITDAVNKTKYSLSTQGKNRGLGPSQQFAL